MREDPRDALVARDGLTLGELPAGSRVGTGSPRRAAQLHALGLGLEVVGIRGNVDTRLRRSPTASTTRCVLARAGLVRLGRHDEVTEIIDPIQMLPAPGQGALAVECRPDDASSPTRSGPRSTTRTPGPRHGRAAAARARSRPAAARRSVRSPTSPRATTAPSSGSARSCSRPDGGPARAAVAARQTGRCRGLGRRLARDCSTTAPRDLIDHAARQHHTDRRQPTTARR